MKHFIRILFCLSISLFTTLPLNAQGLLKNLKNKTQQKIEEKVEERAMERADKAIDKELDKQLDKVEDAIFNDEENIGESEKNYGSSEKRMADLIKKMGVGGEPVPIQDSYTFKHLIQMHIESQNKDGKKTSEGEFITHLSPEAGIMGYEFVSGDMADPSLGLIIIDANNKATIILNEEDGKKSGLVYGLGTFFNEVKDESYEDLDLSESPESYLANPNVKKTGRTKTIAGYQCEEYEYTDENAVSNIWITKDLKMNSKDFFSLLFKTSLYSHGMGWGYMMEATTINKENGEKSTMTVTRVDDNSNKKVVMGDYEVTNLGTFSVDEEK